MTAFTYTPNGINLVYIWPFIQKYILPNAALSPFTGGPIPQKPLKKLCLEFNGYSKVCSSFFVGELKDFHTAARRRRRVISEECKQLLVSTNISILKLSIYIRLLCFRATRERHYNVSVYFGTVFVCFIVMSRKRMGTLSTLNLPHTYLPPPLPYPITCVCVGGGRGDIKRNRLFVKRWI